MGIPDRGLRRDRGNERTHYRHPSYAGEVEDDQALLAIEPLVTTLSARKPLSSLVVGPSTPQQWSFAVLSDPHLPNPRAATVDRMIEGLIALGVRLVIVTGDHTNGSDKVDHRRGRVKAWWASVTDALEPLHAGNHDTYLSWQREGYVEYHYRVTDAASKCI